MNYYICRKLLVVGIILMLSGVAGVSLGQMQKKSINIQFVYRGAILYVGGSGPGNYSTIQAALDNTTDGDTVFVYSGYYFENITINTSISVMGEHQNSTVIDGVEQGTVVTILADGVFLCNFSIQNACEPLLGWGYGIHVESCNNTIKHNVLGPKNIGGIALYDAHNNTITRNTFYYNRNAIILQDAHDNDFIENQIGFSDVAGVNIWDASDNRFFRNNFMFNMLNTVIIGNSADLVNNSWEGNYWSVPVYQPKRIPVLLLLPFRLTFQFDSSPSPHPNGALEIYEHTVENKFLIIRGRVGELFNTSSWTGEGLKVGRLDSLGIIVNYSYGEQLRITGLTFTELFTHRVPTYSEVYLKDVFGMFYRPRLHVLKNLPPRLYTICFTGSMTQTYYVYGFGWD